MRTINLSLLLLILMGSAHADVFLDIKNKAGKDPEAFWNKNRVHLKPITRTYTSDSYDQVTVKPKYTVLGEEASPCIDCNKNYKTAVSEYIFNMYLRLATSDKYSYLLKCDPNYDGLIGLDLIGVFDPLFANRNTLSLIMNLGNLRQWYWNYQAGGEYQERLIELMKNIGVVYDMHATENQDCDSMFVNMLEKSMSYYGIEKSLDPAIVKSPNYSKVEPLYYYAPVLSDNIPSTTWMDSLNTAFASAIKRCISSGDREFVYYYQGEETDYQDKPGGGLKITKTINYTYRPVINECRALSYVVGAKLVDTVYNMSDLYEVWAVPHVKGSYLALSKGAVLANGKLPSKKWTYHVAIVAVAGNVPVVLDGLFYKEAVSLAEWQKLFNPSTRFMLRPFVKTKRIDASFIKPTGENINIRPHPVYQ